MSAACTRSVDCRSCIRGASEGARITHNVYAQEPGDQGRHETLRFMPQQPQRHHLPVDLFLPAGKRNRCWTGVSRRLVHAARRLAYHGLRLVSKRGPGEKKRGGSREQTRLKIDFRVLAWQTCRIRCEAFCIYPENPEASEILGALG